MKYLLMTDGIGAAVQQARAVAGGKDVLLAGGVSIAQQALAAGCESTSVVAWQSAGQLEAAEVPHVRHGSGDLRCVETFQAESAVHLRYETR